MQPVRGWMIIAIVGSVGAALGLAVEAGAVPIGLQLDPSRSRIVPETGAPESLSGTIALELGSLPPLSGNTSFDVVGLDVHSSGGLVVGLDPSLADPGLGVLDPAGSFLLPNLFLRVSSTAVPADLTVLDVNGAFGSGCGGGSCLETSFQIDSGGSDGILTVEIFAVPEPGSALGVALGLIGIGARRRVARGEGSR